ncbi:hypothetical protein [Candidatus Nanohalovita haloferacivicina]|uniref:hypothetical protein n=1 Tax=Candidatus Nanohalovita haloferacivicina TaxID=2978046 RepID=UPI00325FD73F|nr:hypothetical protein HBNXNv_1023 [Candidatus Nanohalobia archaeon BNXNv]
MILLAYGLVVLGFIFLIAAAIRRHKGKEYRDLMHTGIACILIAEVAIATFLVLF